MTSATAVKAPKSLDNVPETDTAPKPGPRKAAAPKAKAPANPAPKPEAPAAPTTEVKVVEVPSGYAVESVRNQLHDALAKLRADGWTRPMISRHTDFTDSQVWRGQNLKVHQSEMDRWLNFLAKVADGSLKPDAPAKGSKKVDLQPKVDAALEALASEAKTVAQYRAIVKAAVEALSA